MYLYSTYTYIYNMYLYSMYIYIYYIYILIYLYTYKVCIYSENSIKMYRTVQIVKPSEYCKFCKKYYDIRFYSFVCSKYYIIMCIIFYINVCL